MSEITVNFKISGSAILFFSSQRNLHDKIGYFRKGFR